MQLTFCGAAQQVTGSSFLFEAASSRFLVDCGMFQGDREIRSRNLAPFSFDPRGVDFVILTHAHIDHSGLLPRLHAEGFAGPIYATDATRDLVSVLLPDSACLQQMEAERAARHDREFKAVYGMEDARAVLLLESTYGNRNHKPLTQTLDELVHILTHALEERHGARPARVAGALS